ncbi:N-acetyltransferase [Pseudonocardia sp. EV170527-09]|uniref:GNAT family N-acetyltransferase n=1 Tax=Pseudonocardia sp. EV170527-09 TaxID=2603411 RepID=UPI001386D088|nr:N-acetyltransferase [Pseudonocardia sp. EV170527-09]
MARSPRHVIRAAVAADAPGIADVCTRAYRATYRDLLPSSFVEDVITRFYDEDRVRSEVAPAPPHWLGYVVAAAGSPGERGSVLGAAGGAITGEGVGELYVLYLDPDRRGEGIGTRLLDHVTVQLRDHGAREMWVSVAEGNDRGVPFYRARGFVERGRVPMHTSEVSDGLWSLRMFRPLGGG